MNKFIVTLLLLPALLSLSAAKGPRYSDDGAYIALESHDDYQQSYVDVQQEAGIEPLASGDQPDTEIAERPATVPEVEPKEGKDDETDEDLAANKDDKIQINNDVNEQAQNATAQGDTEVVDRPDTKVEVEPKEGKQDETDEDLPSNKDDKIQVDESQGSQEESATAQSDTEVLDRPDTKPEVEPTERDDSETDEDLPTNKDDKIDVDESRDENAAATDNASDQPDAQGDTEIVDRPDTKPEVEPTERDDSETDEELSVNKDDKIDVDEALGFVPDLAPEDTGFVPPEASEAEPTSGIAMTGTVTDYIEQNEFIPQLEVNLTFVDNGEEAFGDNGEFGFNSDTPIEGEEVLNWFTTGHIEKTEAPQIDTDGSQMQDANWTDFTEGADAVNKTGNESLQVEHIPHIETSEKNTETKSETVETNAAPAEATATVAEHVETAKSEEPEEQGKPLDEDPNLVAYGDGVLINNPEEYSIVDYHGEEPVADNQKPIDTGVDVKKPEKIQVEESGFLGKKK